MSFFNRFKGLGERANHITFPEAGGILLALAVYLFVWNQSWEWGVLSFLTTVFLMILGFLYGKVIVRLIIETYWLTKGESMMNRNMIIWGWIGIIVGAILFQTSMFDAPLYIRVLNFMLGSGVIWLGPVFPMMVLGLKDEPEAQSSTEQL